jgi:hypothetical protein
MFNMSASMGPKFAETVNEMTERVRRLGPSPLHGEDGAEHTEAAPSEENEGDKQNDS